MTMRKTAVSYGWAFGLAEEFGRAARWIVLNGVGDLESLLNLVSEGPLEVRVFRSIEVWEFRESGAAGAISAFDVLVAGMVSRVCLSSIPWLDGVLGLAGASATAYRMTHTFSSSSDDRELAAIWPDGGHVNVRGIRGVSDVVVSATRAEQSVVERDCVSGVQVDEPLWHRMTAHAAKTYVPSSVQSRRFGAGAEVSNNE